MNSAVRAVARMGIYVGCKVYLIKEVSAFIVHSLSLSFSLSLYAWLWHGSIYIQNLVAWCCKFVYPLSRETFHSEGPDPKPDESRDIGGSHLEYYT